MPAGVGISFIEKFTSSDPHTTTTSASTTTGSTLVVGVVCPTGAPTTLSDNKGNGNYTLLGTVQISGFGDWYTSYYYKENATGGASHTWTADHAAAQVGLIGVQELTGMDAASYITSTFASNNDDASSPYTLATGAAVTVDGIALMFSVSQDSGTETFTANDGYTKTAENTAGGVPFACVFLYKVASSTAVQTGSVSMNSSEPMQVIAGFLAGAGSTQAPRSMHQFRMRG